MIPNNLRAYLESKGALDAYITNCNNVLPEEDYVGLKADDICDAFAWHISPEGWEFWLNMHKEYDENKDYGAESPVVDVSGLRSTDDSKGDSNTSDDYSNGVGPYVRIKGIRITPDGTEIDELESNDFELLRRLVNDIGGD